MADTLEEKSKKIKKISTTVVNTNGAAKKGRPKMVKKKSAKSKKEDSFSSGNDTLDEDFTDEDMNLFSSKPKNTEAHSGRPYKPSVDIDDIPADQESFEDSESKLLFFLGDRLHAIPGLEEKPSLENVHQQIKHTLLEFPDVDWSYFERALADIFGIYQGRSFQLDSLTKFKGYPVEQVFAYFLLWLGRYAVKAAYIKDIGKITLTMYQELIKTKDTVTLMNTESFKTATVEKLQALDYDFIKFCKLSKQDVPIYLKDLVNLISSLLCDAVNP
jgi:hypothetical protein